MLWDIYGQDDFQTVQPSQLRGMSGYLLVVDGTRRATLDTARQLQQKATDARARCRSSSLLNKADLAPQWEIDEAAFFKLVEQGWRVVRTSAKTGEGVEEAFVKLARAMLPADRGRREDASERRTAARRSCRARPRGRRAAAERRVLPA